MYRTDFWTLWEKARVGCFERTACILSKVKQITRPGWMHETSAWAWCTGKTQRNRVEREVGGGTGMGNTCNSMADSCQCMTKRTAMLWNGWPPTNKNKWKKKINFQHLCIHLKSLQSCLTLCNSMNYSLASLSFTIFWSLLKFMSIELMMPYNHLSLCHFILLLPSIFPSIRVISNESTLCIRWPK